MALAIETHTANYSCLHLRRGAKLDPSANATTGVICGVRVEEREDPGMRSTRCLNELADEPADGRPRRRSVLAQGFRFACPARVAAAATKPELTAGGGVRGFLVDSRLAWDA